MGDDLVEAAHRTAPAYPGPGSHSGGARAATALRSAGRLRDRPAMARQPVAGLPGGRWYGVPGGPRGATRGLDRPRPPVPGRRPLRSGGPQPRPLPPVLLRVTREPARVPRRVENRWTVRADGRSHRPGAGRGAGPGLD